MAVGDIYEVSIVGAQTGSVIVNTLNYKTVVSIGIKASEMAALAEEILNTVMPSLAALCSNTVNWNAIRVRDVADPLVGFDRLVSVVGAGTSEPMPKQIAGLIVWKTGLIGRRNTGRMYLPGVEEINWTGSAWASAYLAAITAFAGVVNHLLIASFPDPADTFEFQQVVYSDTYLISNNVTSFGVSPNPATQRRRKSGVGA